MLIVSQNRQVVTDTDSRIITAYYNQVVIQHFFHYPEMPQTLLGTYKTEAKTKEILQQITQQILDYECAKACGMQSRMQVIGIYQMPEDAE